MIPEDWEVKQVGEIANKFFNGGTPSTQKSEYWSGNIPWITGADIVNQRIDAIRRYITDEAVKNSSTNIIEEGNLLLVTRTGVGKMTIAPFDVAISQDITGIYVKDEIDVEYLFRFFDFHSSKLKELNQGTSIAGITRETLITTSVAYPPTKAEQTAIATALSDVDALITSLDQLIAKKRDIKQATMQQLLTGKMRLPGFSCKLEFRQTEIGMLPDDWNITIVAEITINHKQGYYTKDHYVNKGIKLVRITDLNNLKLTMFRCLFYRLHKKILNNTK